MGVPHGEASETEEVGLLAAGRCPIHRLPRGGRQRIRSFQNPAMIVPALFTLIFVVLTVWACLAASNDMKKLR